MSEETRPSGRFEEAGFIIVVLMVSLAFGWLIAPYFGAILWGLIAAIVFMPVHQRLLRRLRGRQNLAATLTLLLIIALVILPAFLLGSSLVGEAAGVYEKIQAGEISFASIPSDLTEYLPARLKELVDASGGVDMDRLREMLASSVATLLQTIASRALLVGQGALSFLASMGIMLYLTFFLLRDGDRIGARIKAAIPLRADLRDGLIGHFVTVVRATMKGTVVVAVMQGLVGGLIFWFLGIEGALLWGLLMGFFSLIPAVGTGIVWVPMAAYLLLTGSVWQGMVLVGCGIFVIGLIDNLLRPILVGQDTRMPDFVVLISTLAGLELFGLNGFIVGPVIAALFMAVWTIVAESRGGTAAVSEG